MTRDQEAILALTADNERLREALALAGDYVEANQGGWCREGAGSNTVLRHIREALAGAAVQPEAVTDVFESVGWQYKFPSIWGGIVWRDSPNEHNGSRPTESREIFAKVTTSPTDGARVATLSCATYAKLSQAQRFNRQVLTMSKRLSERLRAMLYEDIALEVEAMENELASARKLLATRVESARLSEANTKLAEADALIAKGLAVVHDFLPNIGRCVLQDYQRMNEFCSESAARAADPTDGARFTHKVTCPATSEDCYMGGVCTCGATDQQDVTP